MDRHNRDRRSKEFWTLREVMEFFQLEENFLAELEEEEIVCPTCREDSPMKLFSATELEKIRLIKILVDDMEVNLPGVEIILHMRQRMFEMRRQFDAIMEEVARHIQDRSKRGL
jgi:MerR family transcriptional regulator/heat shock protein HspR